MFAVLYKQLPSGHAKHFTKVSVYTLYEMLSQPVHVPRGYVELPQQTHAMSCTDTVHSQPRRQ